LARAMAQDASVLLLDEPTAGLDLKYQYECLERVQQLVKQRNLLAVITLHDLNQAALFADRIALLCGHHLLAVGPPREVLTPQLIEQAFGIAVQVIEHPTANVPLIVPLRSTEART
jgi:iron complex transport system ATP-binding protein